MAMLTLNGNPDEHFSHACQDRPQDGGDPARLRECSSPG